MAETAGGIMLAGSILSAGFTAGLQSSCLRAQAKTLEALSERYASGWSSLVKAESALTQGISSDTYKTLDTMNQLTAQMRLNRIEYKKTYKQLQVVGIIILIIVFFLLFINRFGSIIINSIKKR